MKKSQCISLQKWPKVPTSRSVEHRNLSPLTSKILILTNTDIHQIMPISIQHFRQVKQKSLKDITKISQLYLQQIQYRRQKLKLLQNIWKKNHIKILNDSSSLVNSSSQTLLNSKRFKNIHNTLNSKNKTSRQRNRQFISPLVVPKQKKIKQKSLSPFPYKKSKKKSSQFQYFEDYSHKKCNADESTKSNRKINKHLNHLKRSVSPNQDYYQTSIKKNTARFSRKIGQTLRISETKSEDLYEKLQFLLDKWSQIFDKHAQQLNRAKSLTITEKRRLEKMQRIQQSEIKKQIDETCQLLTQHKGNHKSLQFKNSQI